MTFVLVAMATSALGLLVNELYAWLPWVAARAITWATRCLPEEHRERYEEEWLGELEALPTKGVTSLLFAVGVVSTAPKTARALAHRTRSPITKRALDLSFSALVLFVFAPLLAAVAVSVRVDGPGPIFFRQGRLGRGGRLFVAIKFRSMIADADAVQDAPIRLNESTALFKIERDPRITRVGRFLRRTSLDQLPQLFNVIRGEMAVVGPRPRTLGEPPLEGVLANVKPGMTSWTALAAAGLLDAEEAHRRDVGLATAWTLRGELRLVAATLACCVPRRQPTLAT